MKTVYDIIKKQNGETFARTIRNFDNGIFDVENLPEIVRFAGRDAKPLLPYLNSLKDIKDINEKSTKNPFDLLDKAGYNAFHADTLKKQNSIKIYFENGEEICTFNDPTRFERYYIINAVKHDVETILRKNFINPSREDAYGTSVISIQIIKTGGSISIKNRYNHIVQSCDNTFNSNPDNIYPGLSAAIKGYFNVDFTTGNVRPPDGFLLIGDQIVRYNHEINATYYGDGFVVKDFKIIKLNPGHQMVLDYFIFDTKEEDDEKRIKQIDKDFKDSFLDIFKAEIKDEKTSVAINTAGNKCIKVGNRIIVETKNSQIISASFEKSKMVGPNFLCRNEAMIDLSIPNVSNILGSLNILENNGFMAGKLYYDHAMKLRKECQGK
ncbi:MAG: hypothetical protein LBK26_01275 [Rickettsiales bacterium]|jgi:hypothetical protein|nr:hypothetical protein [Rickettsiales bacterium]